MLTYADVCYICLAVAPHSHESVEQDGGGGQKKEKNEEKNKEREHAVIALLLRDNADLQVFFLIFNFKKNRRHRVAPADLQRKFKKLCMHGCIYVKQRYGCISVYMYCFAYIHAYI